MKSGYRVLITEQLKTNSSIRCIDSNYKDFYKLLWELQVPNKIKIHAWRLLNNHVPYLVNLFLRRLSVDVACPICKETPEDSDHLLWKCGVLQQL